MKHTDRVCIGMINDGTIDAALVLDLIQLAKIKDSRFDSFIQVQGKGQITRNRNKVVQEYLKQSAAEWLLFIDSDERLPPAMYKKLIEAADDRTRLIISALVFADFEDANDNKRPIPTIYYQDSENGFNPIDAYPLDQVIEVDGTGTGCLLIHRSVFLTIQKSATENQGKDWCWFIEGAINGTYWGEDLLFSRRLRSLGFKIFAHTGAILPHHKQFWLDDRHHALIREAVIKSHQEQSTSEVPLASDVPSTKEK